MNIAVATPTINLSCLSINILDVYVYKNNMMYLIHGDILINLAIKSCSIYIIK